VQLLGNNGRRFVPRGLEVWDAAWGFPGAFAHSPTPETAPAARLVGRPGPLQGPALPSFFHIVEEKRLVLCKSQDYEANRDAGVGLLPNLRLRNLAWRSKEALLDPRDLRGSWLRSSAQRCKFERTVV
jgi:hypothetical protein